MLKIKLFPKGKKHQRTFRVVVAEARSKYNGKVIADIGFITPHTKTVQINRDELSNWQKKGAQVTIGVDKLLNPSKYPKKIKAKKQSPSPAAAKTETEPKTEVKESPAQNG